MKLIIIGLLNLLLVIQVYAQQPAFKDQQEIEKKASQIIEDLKSSNRLNGKEISSAISTYVKDPKVINSISTMDTSKVSEADLKKMVAKLLTISSNQSAGMCVKEEAKCGGSEQSCCEGLKCSNVSVPQDKMCKANGVQCTDASSCCSGSCETNGNIKSCSPVKKCLRVLKEGANCQPFQSICEIGFCGRVNVNSTNLDVCGNELAACKSNSDCCSKKCESNRCVENFQCQNCRSAGQKVKGAEKCCDGYYPDLDGRCISDYPPASPVTAVPKKKLLQHIIDLIIPSAEADVAEISSQDIGGAGGGSSTTGAGNVPSTQAGGATVGGNGSPNAPGGATVGPNGSQNVPGVENVATVGSLGAGAGIQENPYADFKTCTYVSKKLYYRQLSPEQKKAVDWARAFEFMASGDGVKDFWSKDGKSIYDRAKLAADEIKTNRLENEKSLADIDNFMTCNCISIKGLGDPSVTADQKAFFSSGKCSGMSIEGTDPNSAAVNVDSTDLDSGTSGIKYQELLIQYFAKTAEVNAQLLVQNANTLTKLEALRDYLKNMDWTGKTILITYWSKSRDVNWGEFLLDIIISIEGAVYGFIEWGVSNIFGNNSQTIWNGVADLWQRNPNKTQCHKVGSSTEWWGIRYKFDCSQENFAPNPICGKKIFNSACIKMAAKRTDTGPLPANKFLIDPLFPKSMVFSMDSGFTANYDMNVNIINVGYVPPTFSDANKTALITLAKQYATNQDFYEDASQREAFAAYTYASHLIDPYTNKEAVYPAPGLYPYYENGANQLAIISTTFKNGFDSSLARLDMYGNLYFKSMDQFADDRKSISPGKVKKIQNTLTYSKFLTGSLKNLNGTNSMVASNADLNDNLFSGVDAFSGVGSAQNALGAYNKNQKAKLDNWKKHVGSSSKGKKLSEMRDLSNVGVSGSGAGYSPASGSGSSNAGNDHSSSPAKLDDISDASRSDNDNDASKKGQASGRGATPPNLSNRGSGSDAPAVPDTGAADADNEHIMTNLDRNKNAYKSNEDDTLFSVVSKTYMRNLDKILTRKKKLDEEANSLPAEPAKAE